MKVLICGAGIAGLTLGLRLGMAGCRVVILEASAQLRDQAFMIDFFGPGYLVAEQLGLMPRLQEVSYRIPEVVWIDAGLRPVATLHYRHVERALDGRLITLLRGDLERVLFEALPRSVELRFDCSVEEIRLHEEVVEAQLSCGGCEYADVLIGADGVHSRIRTLMLGDRELAVRFLGLHAAAFVFEDAAVREALANRFMMMSVPGREVGFYPLRGDGVAAFFSHHMPSTALPSSPVAVLEETFGHLGWLIPAALKQAHRLPSIYYDYVGQVRLSRWSFGRVALVGDACQAVSLVAGQGASLAMKAASVLSEELLRASSPAEAFARYEDRLKPLIERKQAAGEHAASWFVPASSWQIRLRNMMVRVADHAGAGWVLRPLIGQDGEDSIS
jgi:2-polyprenyl-6-methoxyphenol hydroxylase-like FAD-dependent oxidoreductase